MFIYVEKQRNMFNIESNFLFINYRTWSIDIVFEIIEAFYWLL